MSEPRLAPPIGAVPTVNEVVTREFPPADSNSPKGQNTWNWLHPPQAVAGRTMIARRFKENEVGNHFHPKDPNKDPERFLLILGKVTFWFQDLFGGHLEIELNADDSGPIEVLIPPYLLHGILVRSRCAWFLEQQVNEFDPAVSHSAEEFQLLALSLRK